jgi:uncharacterized protein YhaN
MRVNTTRFAAVALVALACCLALAACGKSEAEKAKDDVCSARADIGTQVDKLKGLTLSTSALSQIKDGLNAIKADLGKIKAARGKLDSKTQQQVDAANEAFTSQLQAVTQDMGTNLSLQSLQNGATKLKSAFNDLASSYKQAYGPINCG